MIVNLCPCGEEASGAGRKLTALWHVKNLVGVNVLHFEILGGLSMKWSLGKYSEEGCQRPRNFANVVCGAPRGLSESGHVRTDFPVARARAAQVWLRMSVAGARKKPYHVMSISEKARFRGSHNASMKQAIEDFCCSFFLALQIWLGGPSQPRPRQSLHLEDKCAAIYSMLHHFRAHGFYHRLNPRFGEGTSRQRQTPAVQWSSNSSSCIGQCIPLITQLCLKTLQLSVMGVRCPTSSQKGS